MTATTSTTSAASTSSETSGGGTSGGPAETPILLYLTEAVTDGAFEDPAVQADSTCQEEIPAQCNEALSIFSSLAHPTLDILADLVPGGTVRGPNGEIAASFANMLPPNVMFVTSAAEAGLDDVAYWTGFDREGRLGGVDCSNWTSTSGDGRVGSPSDTDAGWFSNAGRTCADPRPFLCACW